MNLGLFGARADNRGLAIQTFEFARHLRPDRVLGIDLGKLSPNANDWAPWQQLVTNGTIGSLEVHDISKLSDILVRKFFTDLDSCYFAETDYDPQRPLATPTFTIAREFNCRTVLDVNPELCRWSMLSPHRRKAGPPPDQFTVPTRWLAEHIPNARLVPQPVNRNEIPYRHRTEVTSILHPVGHPAMRDRAGTVIVLAASPNIAAPITIRAQSPGLKSIRSNVTWDFTQLPNYADAYDSYDLLLAPRRYGGRSLPLLEAAAAGMPIVALDREPEESLLPHDSLVRVRRRRPVNMMGGPILIDDADPASLTRTVNRIIESPTLIGDLSECSDALADSNSWDTLLPLWQEVMSPTANVIPLR